MDLSFAGAYFECNEPIRIEPGNSFRGTDCVLQLTLQLDGNAMYADIRCQFVGADRRRARLRFTGADRDAYQHLRTFMLENASDPEKLAREVRLYPNPAFPREAKGPSFTEWVKCILRV